MEQGRSRWSGGDGVEEGERRWRRGNEAKLSAKFSKSRYYTHPTEGVNPFVRFKSQQMKGGENIQKAVMTVESATEMELPQQLMAVVASCVGDTLPQFSPQDDDPHSHFYAGDVFSCASSFLPHFLTELYHFPADLRHFPADLRHSLTGLHHSKTTHPPMK